MSNWKPGIKDKSNYILEDLYKFYKHTNSKHLSHSIFSKIVKTVNKTILQKIYQGMVLDLPADIGFIGVVESKVKIVFTDEGILDLNKSRISTNWGATNKLWKDKPELAHKKYVYHDNLHTNGRRYKIKWSRLYSKLPAIKSYKFKPARSFQRNLAKHIKNNPNQEYYEF